MMHDSSYYMYQAHAVRGCDVAYDNRDLEKKYLGGERTEAQVSFLASFTLDAL